MNRREILLAASGVAATGIAASSQRALASTGPQAPSRTTDVLVENGRVRYESERLRFLYTFDYDIPSNVSELTIEVGSLRSDEVSLVETQGVTRDSETSFVWRGGAAPRVVVACRAGGITLSDGVSGTYVGDGVALGWRVRTRLPFRARGSVPTRRRTMTFEGEGFAGDGYVYAGPHALHTRTVNETQLAIVVPETVLRSVPHEELLDAFALGERTITPLISRDQMTAFVLPSNRGNRGGFAVRADAIIDAEVASVAHIRSVATHEYIHTLFGVFGSGEMYWLTEAVAEYYGYLLALNAGAGTFQEFRHAATTTRYPDAVLTDAQTMKETQADYRKGAHVLAALDAEIQRESSGNAALIDALTTGEHDLSTYSGFEAAVAQVSDSTHLTEWLKKHVRSSALPLIPADRQYYLLGDRTVDSLQTATATPTPGESAGLWRMETINDATVETGERNAVIRVTKCSSGSATKPLGAGAMTVSFDYEIETEGWWERPYCEILEDGEVIWQGSVGDDQYYDEQIFEIAAGQTTTGRVEKTINRTGPLQVRLGITQSDYCSSNDHGTTWLRVANFEARPTAPRTNAPSTPESTVTSAETPTDDHSSTDSDAGSSNSTALEGPGFGILGALASLGGAGYLLNRRLDSEDR